MQLLSSTLREKVSRSGAFSGQHFPLLGLNIEIYGVDLRSQSEYGKIRARKNSAFEQFSFSGRNINIWYIR